MKSKFLLLNMKLEILFKKIIFYLLTKKQ